MNAMSPIIPGTLLIFHDAVYYFTSQGEPPRLMSRNENELTPHPWAVGGVDFWIVWIFNFLQQNLDCKTKVEKSFFFIYMCSYAEMSFWGPKKRKSHKIGSKLFFYERVDMAIKKIRNFTLISKWGFIPLYLAPIKS
jgi:hypothetical protein